MVKEMQPYMVDWVEEEAKSISNPQKAARKSNILKSTEDAKEEGMATKQENQNLKCELPAFSIC